MAKQQAHELGGCLKWISSERRQFADGLTKSSTRGLLADRIRRHRIKLAWGPHYTAAKKESKEEREESRQEFADSKNKEKKKPTNNDLVTYNPQLNNTNNLESVQEEPDLEEELALEEITAEKNASTGPSATSMRSPMATLVYFTQLKAVAAEFSGGHMPSAAVMDGSSWFSLS